MQLPRRMIRRLQTRRALTDTDWDRHRLHLLLRLEIGILHQGEPERINLRSYSLTSPKNTAKAPESATPEQIQELFCFQTRLTL